MQPVPRIFISATSRDLRTARQLVSEGLRRMECLPIVQDDFPPDYKSVRDMLRSKISTCDAVVHLAGFYYGAEPQSVPPGQERRSFTQMEYEIAQELGLPCYVFLCGDDFPFDPHDPEPEEKRQLQLEHRQRLLKREELYYEFHSREELSNQTRELQLSVESLRDELARERKRRQTTLLIAAAALLVAVAGGIFLYSQNRSQQAALAETSGKVEAQEALIDRLLSEQARLRNEMGNAEGIAEMAEANVARETNRSVEEIRIGVEEAVTAAQAAVEAARNSTDPDADEREARALLQLAEAQLAAGRQTEAIGAYRRRLALLDREQHPEAWAKTTAVLADILFWRDVRSSEPREMLIDAVAWARDSEALGPSHPATLELMLPLSVMADQAQGTVLAEQVLAAREEQLGPDAPETLQAALVLGRRYKVGKEFEKADALFQRVIDTRERLYGETDLRTLSAGWDLAESLQSQERYAEADSLLRRLIRTSSEHHGPAHKDTLSLSAALAYLLDRQGDAGAATNLFRQGLTASERENGPDSPTTQMLANNLAIRLIESADYVEAEKLARKVVNSRIRTIGPNQDLTIQALGTLALALSKTGDIPAYKDVMRQKIAAEIEVFGPDAPVVATDQYLLGLTLMANDEMEPAAPLLEQSYRLREKILGPNAPDTLAALDLLGVLALRLEDWEAAEKWTRKGVAAYESLGSSSLQPLAETLYRLAVSQEELGNAEEALDLARRAAQLATENAPSDHWLHPRTAEMIERLDGA